MNDLRAVAHIMQLDRRRAPESWFARVRSVLLVVGFAGGLAVLGSIGADRDSGSDRTLAVDDRAIVSFDTPGLDIEIVGDPVQAVADGDADLAVTSGAGGALVVGFDPEDEDSTDARTRFAVAVADADRAPVTPVVITTLDPDDAVRDRTIATAVLFGLAFSTQALLSSSTGSAGTTAPAVLEPILVLPILRRRLAAAFALGHARGTVALVGAIGVGLVTLSVLPLPGLGLRASALPSVAIGVGIAGLGLVPITMGLASFLTIGLTGRHRRALGGLVALPFLFAGFLAAQRVVDPPVVYGWLPVISNLGVAADGVLGRLDVTAAVRSLVVASVAGLLLVEAAARMAERESAVGH